MTKDVYTVRQVAMICDVSVRVVNSWLLADKLQKALTDDDSVWIERESLRGFMVREEMPLGRLPPCVAAASTDKANTIDRGIGPNTQEAERVNTSKQVSLLEAYVRELRSKLFYRDGWRGASSIYATLADREKVEAENAAAKKRWDAETERKLLIFAGSK